MRPSLLGLARQPWTRDVVVRSPRTIRTGRTHGNVVSIAFDAKRDAPRVQFTLPWVDASSGPQFRRRRTELRPGFRHPALGRSSPDASAGLGLIFRRVREAASGRRPDDDNGAEQSNTENQRETCDQLSSLAPHGASNVRAAIRIPARSRLPDLRRSLVVVIHSAYRGRMTVTTHPRYDSIGEGYSKTRREEPCFQDRIRAALGDARSVVNVGAGAGSYEPRDRYVVAIEPSDIMAAQRPRALAPAIRAAAHCLPLRDGSVDAAMSVLSLHHWDEEQEQGVRELRRVASGPVVLLTCDPDVSGNMWLMSDYLPEIAELDRQIFPSMTQLATWLGGTTHVEVIPVPRDTCDWMLMSFWAHPERVLDASARSATSGFARMPVDVVERAVSAVRRDLNNGTWDARNGALRELDEYDAGLRLVLNRRA